MADPKDKKVNSPEYSAPMAASKPTLDGDLSVGISVGNEYLVGQQTSQAGSLPEEIPSGVESAAEAKRVAARAAVTQTFWSLVRHQFKKNRVAVYALWVVYFLFALAIFADVLANDKPLMTSYNGTLYFPVFKQYLVDLGIDRWSADLVLADWKELDDAGKLSTSIWPPIRYSESDEDLVNVLAAPGGHHLLGTDGIGRDVLSGMVHGSRIALTIGFVSMSFALVIGIILGAIAGFYGGWIDILISRLIEVVITLPTFFLIITVVAMVQHGSIWLIMVLIGVTSWPGIARFTRGEFLRVRNMDFVSAATALGFKDSRIVFRHVLPNALAPVMVTAAFGIAGAILLEAGLSFLGLGVPPTVVTWGSVLNDARNDIHAWWLAVFPGFAIFLAVVSYNLVGDGLRDALDPRLRD
ncbi:MAG: ABC transporter permease [Bacteroidota bacterium]|nr:ABC transporter permease [Bacteroidota bacterium]MDP4232607.1 ABC transporter permease [Bacteroidota bacterium]MDP4242939.1 ABC transporter permease [Bacteroidota bacterium]MDP4286486.1 ABC transporter permease [Bacteroidota bacterium]